MRVNSFHKAFANPTFKLFAATVIAFCAVFFLASFITDKSKSELFSKRVNLAVRTIGHDLLLRAGDSTSRVLPVTETSKGVFLLQFENEFVFQPDTLVAIVQRSLAKTDLTQYTVTVQQCNIPGIVYGFEINPPDNSIKPCRGRVQPKGCYNIEIAFADFPDPAVSSIPTGLLVFGIPLVLAFLLVRRRFGFKRSEEVVQPNTPAENVGNGEPTPTLGRFVFDSANQKLRIGEETILLTDKEYKILTLLNRNIGQLTLREDLIQEVWTDEGVITGRSLDMFISKLRKKLSADPSLRITNVHGKGYRLEIVNDPMTP
jgi:hypothetical protein